MLYSIVSVSDRWFTNYCQWLTHHVCITLTTTYSYVTVCPYLCVSEPLPLGDEVEADSISSTGKEAVTDEEDEHQEVR